MSDQAIRSALDRLSRATTDARAAQPRAAGPAVSGHVESGLRWQPRDRVIDLLTGLRATVQSGRLSQSTGRGVFVIALATGELTHRDERELERDQAPAPAPGR